MPTAPYPSTASLDAARVLVVDDEDVSRQFVRLHLTRSEELDLAVLTARSVDDAQRLLEAEKEVALVLLDWEMPEKPGIDLLLWMRTSAFANTIPVVMMTARSSRQDVIEAIEAGATDYLVKPIRRQALFEKLRKHLPKQ